MTAEILNSITEWILLRYIDESDYGMRLKAAEPMILPFMIFNLYLLRGQRKPGFRIFFRLLLSFCRWHCVVLASH